MTKWEYKKEILHTSKIDFISFLNIHGKEGWEYIESEMIGSALICIFKRKIED